MFGPEAPPLEWDSRGEYSRQNIEVYYLSHAATPLSLDQLTEVCAWMGVLVGWGWGDYQIKGDQESAGTGGHH